MQGEDVTDQQFPTQQGGVYRVVKELYFPLLLQNRGTVCLSDLTSIHLPSISENTVALNYSERVYFQRSSSL